MRQFLLGFLLCVFSAYAETTVLVTGASRGIGEAIVNRLSEEGYVVYAGVRTISQEKTRDNVHFVELDVTSQESVDAAVQEMIAKEGHIDVLVNNAGVMVYGSVENVTIEEAQKVFDVNFFGMMRVTQAVLPFMRAQESGKIVQISSRSGFRPLPSLSVYAASKFALEGLSETMAATLDPWNIKVALIEPGPVNTELDFISPYGSRLERAEDPYHSIFTQSGLLDPYDPAVQTREEIAEIVKEAIETDAPLFRYQTTPAIQKQAGERFVDISGNSPLHAWKSVLAAKQMEKPLQIEPRTTVLAFAGSTREGSYNQQLIQLAAKVLQKRDVQVKVISLEDFDLPIYQSDLEKRRGLPENARKLRALIKAHQALLIATPEYNGSIPALLKNVLDWTSRDEQGNFSSLLENKPVALMGASSGRGGARKALAHLEEIVKCLGAKVTSHPTAIAKAHQYFLSPDLSFLDGQIEELIALHMEEVMQ